MTKLFRLITLALLLAFVLPLAGTSFDANATCPVLALANDNSTSGNARAPSTRFQFERSVYLILKSELQAAGVGAGPIVGIGWTYQTGPGVSGAAPLKIYLQNTLDVSNTKTTNYAADIAPMTLVHNATTTLPAATGSFNFDFTGGAAFNYTGDGLYVAFDWGLYSGTNGATVTLCNSTGLAGGLVGGQSTGAPQTTLTGFSNFRPETFLKAPVTPVDVSVDFLISMGIVPIGLVGPQSVQATVFQNGDNSLTNTPIGLDVNGSENYTDSVTIASLASCATNGALVTFLPFTATTEGFSLATATVTEPGDADPGNDQLALYIQSSINQYSYQHPANPDTGGVGFTNGSGEFVAKFSVGSDTQLDAVNISFFSATATNYKVTVRGDDGTGKPGAILYTDAAVRTVQTPGPITTILPTPLPITANTNFFVGIRQTNTTNASFSYNTEFPLRSGTFFFTTTPDTPNTWTDFNPGNFFQLNVGVNLGNCLVPMSVDINPSGTNTMACNGVLFMQANPNGGTPTFNYQWTENGVDIPGQTAPALTIQKAFGTFSYNAKVTDAGGCLNLTASTDTVGVWTAPSAAVVNSPATICRGTPVDISANLTGNGPWTVTWSDGFVQSGVTASPATRSVSPAVTTVYSVTNVADSGCGSGPTSGSVTISLDPGPGEVANGPDASTEMLWSSTSQLDWPANANAVSYTLYRGLLSDVANLATTAIDGCTRSSGSDTFAAGLTETPAQDTGFWYAVSGTNSVACEGSIGGAGNLQSSGVCP